MSDVPTPPSTPRAPDKASEVLAKKGPLGLSTAVWIAIIGGGLLVAWYINKNRSNAAPSTTPVDAYQGVGPYAGMGSPSSSTSVPNAPSITTNEQWLAKAIGWATSQGMTVTSVQPALTSWLSGNKISPDQATIVDQVVKAVGPPPQEPITGGVQPTTGASNADWAQAAIQWLVAHGEQFYDAQNAIYDFLQGKGVSSYQASLINEAAANIGPAPIATGGGEYTVNPGSAQLDPVHYTTQLGDTWASLGVKFGGSSELWPQIFNANQGLGLPGTADAPLPTGVTIQIPYSVYGTDKKPAGTYT